MIIDEKGIFTERQRQKKLTLIFADACSVYVARANELKYDEVEPTGSNPKRGWNWARTQMGSEPWRARRELNPRPSD
jgi:hypothetical protein